MSLSKVGTFLSEKKTGKCVSFLLILSSALTVVLISALFTLIWRKLTKLPFSKLGFYRPPSWIKTILLGIFLGVTIKLTFSILVMPLLGYEPGAHGTFNFLKGNLTNALLFSIYVIIVGGFSEELVFRGFLFHQYEQWIGKSKGHQLLMVVLVSLIFGIPHFYQGTIGVVQSVLVGSIFGTMYLLNQRNIWMVVIAHAVFDLVAIYITYSGQSSYYNELLFK